MNVVGDLVCTDCTALHQYIGQEARRIVSARKKSYRDFNCKSCCYRHSTFNMEAY
jgi:hypothetical protein